MTDGAGARPALRGEDEFALALELDRRVAAAGADKTIAIPAGQVILTPARSQIRFLNELVLDSPLTLDATALRALAERWLGHLPYRFVRVDDQAAGERLAPELAAAGWVRGRTVMMTRRAGSAAELPAPDPRARESTPAEHEAVMLAAFEESDYGVDYSPELPRRLVDAQLAILSNTESRTFGAGEDGGLQSMCGLYLDPDVHGVRMGMVEQVGTLTSHRERGLAKAVVSAAMAAAVEWGAELLTVPADQDDWPQIIYAALGFEAAGVQLHFTLRDAGPAFGDPNSSPHRSRSLS